MSIVFVLLAAALAYGGAFTFLLLTKRIVILDRQFLTRKERAQLLLAAHHYAVRRIGTWARDNRPSKPFPLYVLPNIQRDFLTSREQRMASGDETPWSHGEGGYRPAPKESLFLEGWTPMNDLRRHQQFLGRHADVLIRPSPFRFTPIDLKHHARSGATVGQVYPREEKAV